MRREPAYKATLLEEKDFDVIAATISAYISPCGRAGSITIDLMLEGRQYYHKSLHVGGQAVLPYISPCWRAGSITIHLLMLEGRQY